MIAKVRAALLEPLRRRGRTVAWTPEFMGLGNLLQLAMWAYDGTRAGEPRWIRSTSRLEPWLDVFPGLSEVVLRESEIRFTDNRVRPWSHAARAAGADGAVPLFEPLEVAAVERFLDRVVLPGSTLVLLDGHEADESLVVNVRRGDYYDDPEIRAQYGFDVERYLRVAVGGSVAQDGPPASIRVVSDDIVWCRRELHWLTDVGPVLWQTDAGPQADFAAVARSRRSVITNSTFSYWAAHVSNVLHGDNHAQVWVPRFFDRSQNGGRSWLLDERWSVVEGLKGGWDIGQPPTS